MVGPGVAVIVDRVVALGRSRGAGRRSWTLEWMRGPTVTVEVAVVVRRCDAVRVLYPTVAVVMRGVMGVAVGMVMPSSLFLMPVVAGATRVVVVAVPVELGVVMEMGVTALRLMGDKGEVL